MQDFEYFQQREQILPTKKARKQVNKLCECLPVRKRKSSKQFAGMPAINETKMEQEGTT